MKVSKGAIVRIAVLTAALLNQILVLAGKNTLPFTEEEITEGVSAILTAGTAFWVWHKSNFHSREHKLWVKYHMKDSGKRK